MNLPFTLPDWLPPWAFLLLALPVLLWALAFMLMPFSVFGVKARLEAMEAQIDSLHEEVRNLAIRSSGMLGMSPPRQSTVVEDFGTENLPNFGRLKSTQRGYADPAPIATPATPAALTPTPLTAIPPADRPAPRLPQRPPRRMEPRLD